MKKNVCMKIIGVILSLVCVFSTMAALTAFSTSAADTSVCASTDEQGDTKPTTIKEPGIYPIDADHFLIVYKDHTFRIVHGEQPTHNPWTIA